MVKVIEIKEVETSKGTKFYGLIVQSGAISVKSKKTGRIYFTAKTAFVSSTFTEKMATSLIGQEFEGSIRKVACDPYEYTIESTGEIIELSHRWEYFDPSLELENQMVEEDAVI